MSDTIIIQDKRSPPVEVRCPMHRQDNKVKEAESETCGHCQGNYRRSLLTENAHLKEELMLAKVGRAHANTEKQIHIKEGEQFIVEATAKIKSLSEKVERMKEALEKIMSNYNEWKDKGHFCQSKISLQSTTDIARQALQEIKNERK